MSKWLRDPVTESPPEGYWKELTSVVYKEIVDSTINLMQADNRFKYVSSWWDAQVLSISDLQFPAVLVYIDSVAANPLGFKAFTRDSLVKVEYYTKHYKKRYTEELYWFAETFEDLIYNNRRLDGNVPCIQKSTPGDIAFDWAVDGDFVIDAVIVDMHVLSTKSAQGGNS